MKLQLLNGVRAVRGDQPVHLYRRAHERFRIRSLPGPLKTAGGNEEILCFPVDVSRHGLGILTADFLSPGLEVLLDVDGTAVAFEVVWIIQDFFEALPDRGVFGPDERGIFRVGLHCQDADVDLPNLFSKTGCVV